MAPRLSYLPLIAQEAICHFKESAPIFFNDKDVWFEYNAIFLKWYY